MAVSPTQETVCFGLFELDLRAAQLTRNGTKIRLPQQPLQLLSVLIESPGEIVSRERSVSGSGHPTSSSISTMG